MVTNETKKIPVEDAYLCALGLATYNFAYLEWCIVWLTETIEIGFLKKVHTLTAGAIANNFLAAVAKLDQAETGVAELKGLADTFEALISDRNSLVHANPHTAAGGEQRLLYDGRHGRIDWTIQLIEQFSEKTATASIEASRLLHDGRLAFY